MMPYSKISDLPPSVKKKSQKTQRKWMATFNSAHAYATKRGLKDPEAYAFAVANAAIKGEEAIGGGLTINTPGYMVVAADTLNLVGFHGRLHNAMKGDETNIDLQRMHDLVAMMLDVRGVSHKDH